MNFKSLCFLLFFLIGHTLNADSFRWSPVTSIKQPPCLDGKLDDDCWKNSACAKNFLKLGSGKNTGFDTVVKICHDNENVYISAVCLEPKNIRKENCQENNSQNLWQDSVFEIFLQPSPIPGELSMLPPKHQYYHVLITSAGKIGCELGGTGLGKWQPDVKYAINSSTAHWQLEVSIPMKELIGNIPSEVFCWRANFGRHIPAVGEFSSWSKCDRVFAETGNMGILAFVDKDRRENAPRIAADFKYSLGAKISGTDAEIDNILKEAKILSSLNSDGEKYTAEFRQLSEEWIKWRNDVNKLDSQTWADAAERNLAEILIWEKRCDSARKRLLRTYLGLQKQSMLAVTYPAITDNKILPQWIPPLSLLNVPINYRVCRGEISPASFVIYSLSDLNNVTVTIEGDKQLKKAFDIFWVKCWYQAGDKDIRISPKTLTPELLLHNPDLIHVDFANGQNLQMEAIPHVGGNLRYFPDDSKVLLPIKILAEFSQQVWLRLHAPTEIAAGKYSMKVRISDSDKILYEIPVTIEILPFELKPSMLSHGAYMVEFWGESRAEITRTDIQNLKLYGLNTPLLKIRKPEDLGWVIKEMRKAGLPTNRIFLFSSDEIFRLSVERNSPGWLKEYVETWQKAANAAGVSETYFYLMDEAREAGLKREKPYAELIHKIGAKTFCSITPSDYIKYALDFIDVGIVAGQLIDVATVRLIKSKGRQIYSYGNPQLGLELPETYRRNYGLLLWQHEYDGAINFAWYWPFNNIWNDFDHETYKDHNMVYPTQNGLVGTIQAEGWREGVNDCRYLSTLVNFSRQDGKNDQADKLIRKIKICQLEDLYLLRNEMIDAILASMNTPKTVETK